MFGRQRISGSAVGIGPTIWRSCGQAFFEGHEALTKVQTDVKKKTLDPVWDEELVMRTPVGVEQPPALICRVFDDDMMGKDFLGEVSGHNLCRPCVHSQDRLI